MDWPPLHDITHNEGFSIAKHLTENKANVNGSDKIPTCLIEKETEDANSKTNLD
jgi:hypothetical protein